MRWLTQLAHLPGAAAKARRLASGGGPRRVRVLGLGQPTGLIVPSSTLRLEVRAASGAKTRWEPEIPIPFPYALAYRLSRKLGVPLISSRDPENLTFSITLPRARRGHRC